MLDKVKTLLKSPERRKEMVEHNYTLAARHFSYNVLRQNLDTLLAGLMGNTMAPLQSNPETEDAECLLTPMQPQPVTQAF